MIVVALAVMIIATLAQHLGLSVAVAQVVTKIAKCPKCLTFWLVLSALCVVKCNIIVAVGLSLLMSYLSLWVGLVYVALNKLFMKLWQKLN